MASCAIRACRPLLRARWNPSFGAAGPSLSDQGWQFQSPRTDDQCVGLVREAAPGAAVAAAATPHGWGLRADRPLPASDLLLSVNVADTLCVGFDPSARRSAAARRLYLRRWQQRHGGLPHQLLHFLQKGHGVMPDVERLMAWLLWLRRSGRGLWRRYLDLLPRGEATPPLPLFFSEAELEQLQMAGLAAAARHDRRKFAAVHQRLFCGAAGQLCELHLASGLEDTLWAAATVLSRAFHVRAGSDALTLLAPGADLANHSQQPSCLFWLDEAAAAFQLVALEDLAAGDEATIRYGASCGNDQLLRQYGFTLQGNIWDRLPLPPAAGSGAAAADVQLMARRPPASLSAPRLLAAMRLRHSLLDSRGLLDLEAMGQAVLGSSDPEAVQQRRRLAVLGSLQLLMRDLPVPRGGSSGGGSGSGGGDSSNGSSVAAAGERQSERELVAAVIEHWRDLLHSMPTSLRQDEQLLEAAEELQQELSPGSHSAGSCNPGGSSFGGNHGGGSPSSSEGRRKLGPRRRAAVEARLERKRLLQTGIEAMQRYLGLLG